MPPRAEPLAPQWLLERLPVDRSGFGTTLIAADDRDPATPARFFELLDADEYGTALPSPVRIEYTFDAALTEDVIRILRRARAQRGHVIVLDPRSGRVLAYVSTDAERFPPTKPYPAASLVKVVTAAAALDLSPDRAREPCLYRGNPYRLSRSRVHRPSRGHSSSLERALALSNNQCFAQLTVDTIGEEALLAAIDRFGWTSSPAPGHERGVVNRGEGDYDLGRLGCGLAGCRITPLHAGQLAAILAHGLRIEPWWIDRVSDGDGRVLALPKPAPPQRVMSERIARELREMLVLTTTRGTARSAFRDRRGRSKLGPVLVAGKTGNLSGSDPKGRFEWFMGVAPSDAPTIAVAVLQAQDHLWWARSSEIGADVFTKIFCDGGTCAPELADRFTGDLHGAATPVFLAETMRTDQALAR
jgi:cell division protein FtsI/penicillin-binding protein 2